MVWKGGPRSSRSYKMDQYRQSSEPWEKRDKPKGFVKQHYSTSKRGNPVNVRHHWRRR